MLIHDVIKIKYSREGYLPNYPPHLISDDEMCEAFLTFTSEADFESDSTFNYFKDNYPFERLFRCNKSISEEDKAMWKARYYDLVRYIASELSAFIKSSDENRKLPDWIYAYMIGSVISVNSDKRDIHDLLVMMNIDNLDDDFLSDCAMLCYKVSEWWLRRIPATEAPTRPPGMFGEPHVIKQLKLSELGIEKQVI